MSYRVAGIDVHKKLLAVVVTDASREGELQFVRRKFGIFSIKRGSLGAVPRRAEILGLGTLCD